MTFTLVIAGRPNVGKSTLFNRMAGKALALVNDTPGLTRDWREADGEVAGRPIRLIDTAGLEDAFDDSIPARMRRQTEGALAEADAVVFVVDGRAGITPLDAHFAGWLRRQNKPVILCVNKCENEAAAEAGVAEAYGLGLGDPVPVSAAHGLGLADLYDVIEGYLPEVEEEEDPEDDPFETEAAMDAIEGDQNFEFVDTEDETKPLKLTIAGRPNVGKSTLLNALLGADRVMTGPEAGITRDAIAVDWTYDDRAFTLVDTAGLRRKARVQEKIEKMAVEDTLRAVRLAQAVVLVLDGTEGLEKQDLTIAGHVAEEGRILVIAVNKWDVVKDKNKTLEDLHYRLGKSLAQLPDVPVVTVSALNRRNLDKLMKTVLQTYEIWKKRTPTGKLNRWLSGMEERHPPPLAKGGKVNRLKYIAQIKNRPPTFALWCSRPSVLPEQYKRYLINGLREDFDLPGVPIRLLLRASKNPYGGS